MSNLRTAAQQALEFCEFLWREVVLNDWAEGQREATEATLRAALVEPVQEPDSPERRCGGPGCDMTCCQPVEEPQGCAHCNHPLYAAVKCRVCGRVTEPTPPQRKPLAEWQINDLMADIDPEDRDSWSFRQGVYAAEKHHGVRK